MRKAFVVGCSALMAACWSVSSSFAAQPILSFNTSTVGISSNQQILLNISGTDSIGGADIYAQIEGSGTLPTWVSLYSAVAGTLIGGLPGALDGPPPPSPYTPNSFDNPNHAIIDSSTSTGAIVDSGELAILTLDTSSLHVGDTFSIILANVDGNNQFNTDVVTHAGPTVTPTGAGMSSAAQFTVVAAPEPGSFMILLPVAVGWLDAGAAKWAFLS